MKKVAIQGTLGSYHDIAAHKYFEGEEIELICCANFEDVFGLIMGMNYQYFLFVCQFLKYSETLVAVSIFIAKPGVFVCDLFLDLF